MVVRSRDADCPVPSRQLITPSAWNSKLIQALGAGPEQKLGEVITEVFKPEGKEIFAIHVRGTYADYDTIGTHREIPSRVAEKGACAYDSLANANASPLAVRIATET